MARSIAELEKLTAVELRKIVSDMMKENPNLVFVRNGMEISSGEVRRSGRKAELVLHLSKWEVEMNTKQATDTQTVESKQPKKMSRTKQPAKQSVKQSVKQLEQPEQPAQPAQPAQPEEIDYSESEKDKKQLAQRIYSSTLQKDELTGLQEYQLKLCQTGKYFLPEFAILVARVRVIIETYANARSLEGKAHPGTIQKIRVDVMKYLKQIIDAENDKFPSINDRELKDTFKDFDDALRGAFSDIGAAKYRLNKDKNEKAEEDVRAIKVKSFIEWAVNTVSNLPMSTARWKEVAIAIMLLTGRRQSEVLATGTFKYVDDSHVIFEGQLKRHQDELVPPETIPVLGKSAKAIVSAIEWLNTSGKRTIPTQRSVKALQESAKQSHNRCSRYIAETMEKLSDKVEIINGKEWEIVENGKIINYFKGHLTRQIYAQVCSALFNNPNEVKKRAFISKILLENRDAALIYDRDIEIKDTSEIESLCGKFS